MYFYKYPLSQNGIFGDLLQPWSANMIKKENKVQKKSTKQYNKMKNNYVGCQNRFGIWTSLQVHPKQNHESITNKNQSIYIE